MVFILSLYLFYSKNHIMENNKIVGILTLGDLAANPDVNNSEVTNTLEDICNCNKKNAE